MTPFNSDTASPFQRLIPPNAVRDRYQGCLRGGAVGDALGAPVEFLRRTEILERFGQRGIVDFAPAYGKVGAITDDTQMTMFTAEGVLRAYVRGMLRGICHQPSVIHKAYLRWLYTQGEHNASETDIHLFGWLIQQKALFSLRAPGRTCIEALRSNPEIGKPALNHSKGCGGVMRVAPIGMLFHALTLTTPKSRSEHYQRSFALGCEAAALTHGHPTGYLTAGVMAALVFDLLDGIDLGSAISHVLPLLNARERHDETLAAIEAAQRLNGTNIEPIEAINELGEGWVAEEALAIGLYCALKAQDFESGVIMAVNHDGDSDSTGLIAGHLLGAMQGRSAIPERWLSLLELRGVMEEMADDLATAGSWRLGEWHDPDACAEEEYYVQRYPGG